MKHKYIFISLLLAITANISHATIYYVNINTQGGAQDGSSWANAYPGLQSALVVSQYGDTIWVAQGTYLPSTGTNRNISFTLKNGLKLFGGFSGIESSLTERDWITNSTILSGDIGVQGDSTDNAYNVVYCNFADSTTIMDGFTITGGNADSQASGPSTLRPKSGGGLYLVGSSQTEDTCPVIANCTFTGNYARFNGGGIFLRTVLGAGATPLIINCNFQNNRAGNGGGIYKEGGSLLNQSVLNNCIFTANLANYGSGFYFYNNNGLKDILISESIFKQNQSVGGGSGAGLYEEVYNSECKLQLIKCSFIENVSTSGTAIGYIDFINTNGLNLDSCIFTSNASIGEGTVTFYQGIIGLSNSTFISNITSNGIDHGNGGCVFMDQTTLKATNCVFAKSKSYNGAIAYIDGTINQPAHLELTNCTIFQNESIINGLIRGGNSAEVIIENCIINGNSLTSNGKLIDYNGVGIAIQNTLVDVPDCASIAESPITCGPGMLYDLDPLFLDTAAGDFHLSPCSPARNAGDNPIVNSLGILTDLEGNSRIQGGTVDMGAYESTAFETTNVTVTSQPCNGSNGTGTVSLTLENGCPPFFLDWGAGSTISDSSLALLDLPIGSYSITVSDEHMETDTVIITITVAPAITAYATANPVNCATGTGGTASVEAVGGTGSLSFSWSAGGTADTVIGLAEGSYQVTVTDASGCTAVDSVEVSALGSLALGINIQPITCPGDSDGSATVQPIGGVMPFVWLWQSGEETSTIDSLGGGTYSATVTDALGCMGDIDFTITPPTAIGLDIMVLDPACFGGSGIATADATGGTGSFHYVWDSGAMTVSAQLPAGQHGVTATDANGCTATGTATITAPPMLVLTLAAQPPMLCHDASDGSIIVNPMGGIPPYSWSGQLEDLSAGTYTITLVDANTCTATATATLAELPEITATGTIMDASSPTALDGSITLSTVQGGTGSGYTFHWDNGLTTQGLSSVPTGEYAVTVTDSQGCTASYSYFVDFNSAVGAAAKNPFGAAIVPNPSGSNGARLVLYKPIAGMGIKVFDAKGSLIFTGQDDRMEYALPKGLANGTYLVVLEHENKRTVLTWVKE